MTVTSRGENEMTITSRAWNWDDYYPQRVTWDDYYLQRVTLRWLLPPEGDIKMTITSRGWHWDDCYLQRETLRWLLTPEGDIEMTITSRGWYKENLIIIVAPQIRSFFLTIVFNLHTSLFFILWGWYDQCLLWCIMVNSYHSGNSSNPFWILIAGSTTAKLNLEDFLK